MINYREQFAGLFLRATRASPAQDRDNISRCSPTQGNLASSMTKVGRWKLACGAFFLFHVWTAFSFSQTLKTLVDFNGSNGSGANAPLVDDADGNFYGTTAAGGAHNLGTVFRVTTNGELRLLHSFCKSAHCADGEEPAAGLVRGNDKNFYGITAGGGAWGWGTIFRVTPSGKLTVLHSFDSSGGAYPYGRLLRAADGNFYGTTSAGGRHGYGTAFKLAGNGEVRVLYDFCSKPQCADGSTPVAGLVQGRDRDFYGTTLQGGLANGDCGFTCGTIFKLSSAGKLTTLYKFLPAIQLY
jgi:uncharacterized repeat protein (TIGR03803 family)